ncbi:MAG: 4Fe-4S dicluster domain-containing protein [Pseudomonadota bacterium]
MADDYLVEPDLGFINEVSSLGGRDLKKCFQCATCSVVCPISPDTRPFPRKEMIATGWGLKNRVINNSDIWLCHNCGDCTTRCPRGAAPGEVLAAVRAYAGSEYVGVGPLKKLANAVNDPKMLPVLLAVPAVIFLVMGLISNLAGLGWLNFSLHGDEIWQGRFINNYLVDIIMVPTFTFSIAVFALGLKNFVTGMHANALAEGKTGKKDQTSMYKDWYLIGLVMALGLTGMLSQMFRLGGVAFLSYLIYFLHLVFVWSLFAYTPYSKLAHLIYRTVALGYNEWSGRK